MGNVQARLRTDLTAAIRSRDELRAATIRMALTAIKTAEVAGEQARVLDDQEVLAVLGREAKKRREAAEAYDAAGRVDLAERERAEGAVIAEYLPAQLSDSELAALVAAAIEETAAEGPRGMGVVMKAVSPTVAGRADGARVAAEVRRQLAG